MEKKDYDAKMEQLVKQINDNSWYRRDYGNITDDHGISNDGKLLKSIRELIEYMLIENGFPNNPGAVLHMSYKLLHDIRGTGATIKYQDNKISADNSNIELFIEITNEKEFYMKILKSPVNEERKIRADRLQVECKYSNDGTFSGINIGLGTRLDELKNMFWTISFTDKGLPATARYAIDVKQYHYMPLQPLEIVSQFEYGERTYNATCYNESQNYEGEHLRMKIYSEDNDYPTEIHSLLCYIPGLTVVECEDDSNFSHEYGDLFEAIQYAFKDVCTSARNERPLNTKTRTYGNNN